MIGFNDLAFQAGDTAEFYEKLLNGENDEALRFRKYYRDMSGGRLDIEVTVVNTGYASNDIAYYGANDGEGYDVRPATLVGEAIDGRMPAGSISADSIMTATERSTWLWSSMPGAARRAARMMIPSGRTHGTSTAGPISVMVAVRVSTMV